MVEWAKSPNAMPEFWTWWMLNGPIEATASPIGSRVETIDFVSWSATIAVPAMTASATHWRRPAPSGRSALEIGCRAFVDEPTRTSIRRGGSVRAGSLNRLLPSLVVEAQRRVRNGIEPLLRDRGAADGARAVGAGLDARRAPRRSRR